MPVGGSVDEGVAILRYGGALRPSARCLDEAVERRRRGAALACYVSVPASPRALLDGII